MMVDNLNINSKFNFKDEGFDASQSKLYQLLLELSDKHLSISVYDTQQNKVICLEHYTFGNAFTANVLAGKLPVFFAEHSFAKLKFAKTILSYVTQKFTLVPKSVFDVSKRKAYFDFNNTSDVSLDVKHSEIKSANAVVIFAIPQSIENALKQLFPSVEIVSSFSPFVDSSFKNRDVQYNNELFLHISNDKLFVCLFKNGKFHFANCFNYTAVADAGYYINLVLNQFQITVAGCKINFSGIVDKNDNLFIELQKFSITPSFSSTIATTSVSYKLQEIPVHYFVQLYSLVFCE